MSHGTGDQPSSDDLSRSVGQSSSSTVTDNHSFHVEWLSERFAESVRTSDRTESGSSSSNRLDAFKRWRNLLDRTLQERQEIRRLWALERQRKYREDQLARTRSWIEFSDSGTESENENGSDIENDYTMEQTSGKRGREADDEGPDVSGKIMCLDESEAKKKKKKKQRRKQKWKMFANQVMYGETMEDVPHDLRENWVMMVYPQGRRCVVVSGRGMTIARLKSGRILNRFQSILPNGSKSGRGWDSEAYCVLDCVYDPNRWIFYVLDVMCWKGYSIYNCDTDFRHFWLQTKFNSEEMDAETSENSFYKFQPLRPIPTTALSDVLADAEGYMKKSGFTGDIDGFLFYHRECQYIAGTTPLVCWAPLNDLRRIFSCNNDVKA